MSGHPSAPADQRACGKGLAERAPFPAKMAEVIAALAKNLELHQTTLDPGDANAKRELDAYVSLASAFGRIAQQLAATANEMAGYRDLPMGRHDPARMADPRIVNAFQTFAMREEELLALLRGALERDHAMLRSMK